ncbi:MAG: tyrosine-type recombinase/integrase [bacterium]|nr:tyrosine-type recombinase/integrase [bacterium]
MDEQAIVTTETENELALIGQIANEAAQHHVFHDYHLRRSKNTIATHRAGLVAWVRYLGQVGAARTLVDTAVSWVTDSFDDNGRIEIQQYAEAISTSPLIVSAAFYCKSEPAAWTGTTWGLVEGFVKWLLNEGYSVATVNQRLSSLKVYLRLATKAGVIPVGEHALMREVRGYGRTEGKRVDERREQTRVGHKKAEAVVLTDAQVRQLKREHADTPQGIRDRLLLALFLDLGLRASEVAGLKCEDFVDGRVTVYRKKTDTTDTLQLSLDIIAALEEYQPYLRSEETPLLRGSRKNKKLTNGNMSQRAIGNRIRLLGRDLLGIWPIFGIRLFLCHMSDSQRELAYNKRNKGLFSSNTTIKRVGYSCSIGVKKQSKTPFY